MTVWVAVVIAVLAFGGADTLLQKEIIGADITGPLPFVHYVFFVYSPFVLSALCAVLFVPIVAYPFRDFLVAKGWTRIRAANICGLITLVGSFIAYWIVLASWVAITGLITKTR